ncbi:MAG: nuclear transport factor 2 family protein [Actinomycetota bacterium]|nr:nuclear transport factor 2 family protein [Actinomycetota bacterium]
MDITEISDRLEIEQLVARYVEAIDSKDWDLLDTVFTENALLDYESSGGPAGKGEYPAIKTWLQENLAIFPMTQHMVGKSLVEIDGDTASCRTIFYNPMGVPVNATGVYDPSGEELHIFVVGGWYNDTCIRTEKGWRIIEKIEEQAYVEGAFPPFE